ncbi:MAG TPA: MFS transporter [Candidatus Avipropionibacterium avicola]|uniref:MFS transporter n=1 Tax=Candidatus Avipropionibacterium avicola TaxID=2840701 RepID=A0A9D1GXB0_9ACTN|nr:MFS transporter [Candidatus Avipropionibacterium avicola]
MPGSHFVDLSPLKHSAAFTRMWIGSSMAGLGSQLTIVAVMLHMYAMTGSTFAVSMIAFSGLVPMILAGLYGGMLADAFDRRTVALLAACVTWVSTGLLAVLAWAHWVNPAWLYALTIINSASNSIVMATRSAIIPRLIPRSMLPAASALQGVTFGAMVMVGPALGGVLVALTDYSWTYTIDVVLMSTLFLGLWSLPRIRPEGESSRPGLKALMEGMRFLRGARTIRTLYLLDMTAMTFGHPIALFPAVGAQLIGGAEITSGILTASSAVGMFLASVFSGRFGGVRRQTRALLRATKVFALGGAALGVVLLLAALGIWRPAGGVDAHTVNLPLLLCAGFALVVMGASDQVGAIFRSTIMQSAVPDAMRGRQQGIFTVVVAGGPRLGALYMGTLATLTSLWFPPLLGGFVIIAVVAVLTRLVHPAFRDYDAADPVP